MGSPVCRCRLHTGYIYNYGCLGDNCKIDRFLDGVCSRGNFSFIQAPVTGSDGWHHFDKALGLGILGQVTNLSTGKNSLACSGKKLSTWPMASKGGTVAPNTGTNDQVLGPKQTSLDRCGSPGVVWVLTVLFRRKLESPRLHLPVSNVEQSVLDDLFGRRVTDVVSVRSGLRVGRAAGGDQ